MVNEEHINQPSESAPTGEVRQTKPPRGRSSLAWLVLVVVIAIAIVAVFMGGREVATEPDSAAVVWIHDYQTGFDLARKLDKPVLLAFHSAGCVACKRMKATTYHDAAVIAAADDFVPVMIDIYEQNEIAKNYPVVWLPTYVIVTPDNKLIDMFEGYHSAGDFVLKLKAARQKFDLPI